MKMFIIGFAICYLIFSLSVFVSDEFDWDFVGMVMKPWYVLAICVMFLPCLVWKMFRCLRGIPQENVDRMEKCNNDLKIYHICRNVYFAHDKKARALVNRYFFYRIKK